MTINTDDIYARLCTNCLTFLELDENCGFAREMDNKWFQHNIEEGTLTKVLNELVTELKKKFDDNDE